MLYIFRQSIEQIEVGSLSIETAATDDQRMFENRNKIKSILNKVNETNDQVIFNYCQNISWYYIFCKQLHTFYLTGTLPVIYSACKNTNY